MKHIEMYNYWIKNAPMFIAMTGYNLSDFTALLPYFSEAHEKYFENFYVSGKKNKKLKDFSIYKNSPLPTIEDRLVFVLSYQKLNPIQQQQAATFHMTQKQVNLFVHSLTIVLENALTDANVMPAQTEEDLKVKLDTEEEMILIHDGTEREIPRPVDHELQKETYSGKKKKNTLKNGVIINTLCMILFVGATVKGSTHDKKIADLQYLNVLNEIKAKIILLQDTGYQGFAPLGVTTKQPFKKPIGIELTEEQKNWNTALSRIRVMIEHAIGSIKRYRIVKDECRLRKNGYPYKIMAICAGLHNFRVERTPVKYPEIKLT